MKEKSALGDRTGLWFGAFPPGCRCPSGVWTPAVQESKASERPCLRPGRPWRRRGLATSRFNGLCTAIISAIRATRTPRSATSCFNGLCSAIMSVMLLVLSYCHARFWPLRMPKPWQFCKLPAGIPRDPAGVPGWNSFLVWRLRLCPHPPAALGRKRVWAKGFLPNPSCQRAASSGLETSAGDH